MLTTKTATTLVAFAVLMTTLNEAKADLLTNLEAYWNFDELAGGTAADSSVNGADATLQNGASFSPAGGAAGGALDVNGGSQHAVVSGGFSNIINSSFSTSFWTLRDGTGEHFVLGQGDTGSTRQSFHVGFRDADTHTFAFWSDDLNYDNAGAVGDTTNYHHWVGTYDAGTNTQTVYLDGIFANSNVTGGDFVGSGSNDFWIGRRRDGKNFDGRIDEVGVWSRALSAGEASQLYNDGTPLDIFAAAPTPEPSTFVLFAIGMVALCTRRRRRNRK